MPSGALLDANVVVIVDELAELLDHGGVHVRGNLYDDGWRIIVDGPLCLIAMTGRLAACYADTPCDERAELWRSLEQ